MQLRVGKTKLLKELGLIQGVVEKKSTIPILSNLLLEASDHGLMIKGTDLDVSISTWCEAEVDRAGATCIPAKKLFDIVKALPEAEIEIKRNESEVINIACERSRFKMAGVSRENFPEIKTFNGPYVSIPAELLRTFIDRTIFAITNEESRFALNGAKFELSEKRIRMIATDGHRLSFIEMNSDLANWSEWRKGNLDVLIPKKTLAELLKLTSETNESVEFAFDENHLYFKVGRRVLVSRTLTGTFPNYEMVLPKENHNKFVIGSTRCSAAVRRVALMADERSHAVKFDVGEDQVNITSQSAETGEAGETIPVEYAGPKISIGFNADYLTEFFNVVQDGDISFELKDGNSQAQVRLADEKDYEYRYIIMPMRL